MKSTEIIFVKDTVIVKWCGNLKAYYMSLGYEYTGLNTLLEVKISDLPPRSTAMIDAVCPLCGKVRRSRYADIQISGHTLCGRCVGIDDLREKRFGRLVVKRLGKKNNAAAVWICDCDCGKEHTTISGALKSGESQSCGCFHRERVSEAARKDISNKRFGRLIAIKPTRKRKRRGVVWLCVCDCGNEKEVPSQQLSGGNTRSCGCLTRERLCGKKPHNWNPNISKEERVRLRHIPEYKQWRKDVYDRDGYSCRVCDRNKSGTLVAHHLNDYATHESLRTSVDNGITLCRKCHDAFHAFMGGHVKGCVTGDLEKWINFARIQS